MSMFGSSGWNMTVGCARNATKNQSCTQNDTPVIM
ncbi:hypothetical protein SEA_NICEHOUSE_253 [Rhodococcus phage NiceHouse]|nr:hypothetical protein SEA_NICEHOUSE_253 [Rhodococcus phage NiceHouse]